MKGKGKENKVIRPRDITNPLHVTDSTDISKGAIRSYTVKDDGRVEL